MIESAAYLEIDNPFEILVNIIFLLWNLALYLLSQPLHDMYLKVEFYVRVLELLSS